jgi:hypothetical protein
MSKHLGLTLLLSLAVIAGCSSAPSAEVEQKANAAEAKEEIKKLPAVAANHPVGLFFVLLVPLPLESMGKDDPEPAK